MAMTIPSSVLPVQDPTQGAPSGAPANAAQGGGQVQHHKHHKHHHHPKGQQAQNAADPNAASQYMGDGASPADASQAALKSITG